MENDTLVAQTPRDVEGNPIPDEDVNNKMFVVVRNTKSAQNNLDYKLNRGDIIKLGRIKFNVKDYSRANGLMQSAKKGEDALDVNESLESLGNNEFEEEVVEIDCGVVDSSQEGIQCKVCWDNCSTEENPLLNSCQCDGSVRYIHYNCLKYWLKQKMAKKEERNLVSYTWKQFECEICKKPYPYVFRSNGISYRLIDIETP